MFGRVNFVVTAMCGQFRFQTIWTANAIKGNCVNCRMVKFIFVFTLNRMQIVFSADSSLDDRPFEDWSCVRYGCLRRLRKMLPMDFPMLTISFFVPVRKKLQL